MRREDVQEAINKAGQALTIKRFSGPAGESCFSCEVIGRVHGVSAAELAGEQAQQRRMVTIGYKEIERQQWPAPPRIGDRVTIDGRDATVLAVNVGKIGDAVARYDLTVAG